MGSSLKHPAVFDGSPGGALHPPRTTGSVSVPAPGGQAEHAARLRRVALVSPDAAVRRRIAEAFTALRWQVCEAAGGAEGFVLLDEFRASTIVLDSWLPDLEIGECVRELRQLHPSVDVVSMDGSVMDSFAVDGSARDGSGSGRSTVRGALRHEVLHALRCAHEGGLPGDCRPLVQGALRAGSKPEFAPEPARVAGPAGALASGYRPVALQRPTGPENVKAFPGPMHPILPLAASGPAQGEHSQAAQYQADSYPDLDPDLFCDGSSGLASGDSRGRGTPYLGAVQRLAGEDTSGEQKAPATPAQEPVFVSGTSPAGPMAEMSRITSGLLPRLPPAPIDGLLGRDARMLEVSRRIRLVAPRSTAVLIQGPTGTGKELVARALHRLSKRADKPFFALNCAAIPEALLEAELFGHTRGAFTGAVQNRVGRLEAAHGGTLFLDEIGELPLALQAKLLRFIECGELQRVGENEPIRVDVRVLAATHRDLGRLAAAGGFRADLYYRLSVFLIETPPLAGRAGDISLLARHFLNLLGRNEPQKSLSPAAFDKLGRHRWPGNVRELEHTLERAWILAEDRNSIAEEDIDFGFLSAPESPTA